MRTTAFSTLLSALFFGALACGGKTTVAKAPTVPADAAAGAVLANDKGQQVSTVLGPGVNVDLPPDAKDSYNKGIEAYGAGDLTGAKQAFSDAASKAPKSGVPHYALAAILDRLGDHDGAVAEYQTAYKIDDKFDDAAGAYAVALASTSPDKQQQAEAFLTYQQGQKPDSVTIEAYLAEVKSIGGKHDEAQKLAQDTLKKNPDYTLGMLVIARDYYRQKKLDVALYALDAVLDGSKAKDAQGKDVVEIPPRAPDSMEALLLRALIERQTGARNEAITDFAAVVAKRRDIVEADIGLGEMKLEASNAQDAVGPLEYAALHYAPKSAIAHNDLGDCYRVLGRGADAKSQFDTASSLNSTLPEVHYNLGLLYLYGGSGIPGVSGDEDQVTKAIAEFDTYKQMRQAQPVQGQKEDVDQLESTAKQKLATIQAIKAAQAAQNQPPPPATPAGDGGT
jgi:Flp pilus assembly protein TadD